MKIFWNNITEYIARSKSLTIAVFLLIVIIGMITASIVNFISYSPAFSESFYVGGTIAVVSIFLGLYVFAPFYTFKFKYNFLSEYENHIAHYVFRLRQKSLNIFNSMDGIIAIQLFEIHRETLPDEIQYHFKKVFDFKSRKVSRLKDKKIRMPISLIEWIYNLNNNKKPNPSLLNKMKMGKILKRMLFDYFHKNYRNDEKLIKSISRKWKSKIPDSIFYKSIQYLVLFQPVDFCSVSIVVTDKVLEIEVSESIDQNFIYSQQYKKTKKSKENREYYNIHIKVTSEQEGIKEFVVLLIADRRLIPNTDTVLPLFKYMIQ